MFNAALITHEGEPRIVLAFPNEQHLIDSVKRLPGRKWSRSLKAWHLPDTDQYRKIFGLPLKYETKIHSETAPKIKEFEQWLTSKRYSPNTIKTYLDCVKVFFMFFPNKSHQFITIDDIIQFNNDYIIARQLSSTYQNQFVNSLKLFYKIIEHKQIDIDIIHRPRTERKLPRVLSKEEVKTILTAHGNIKHRTMLSLIYACGLRRSELLNITFKDINRDRLTLHVFQSKGKKDRIVPLSPKILEMIEDYYRAYRPKVWLFEGQEPGTQYSGRSLQLILKSALKKGNIKKPATLHWLRHSYATHLVENGTDINLIKELLGHNSLNTTQIYTHVSQKYIEKIRSPFDDL
jgi:integrase/recombinase XerD